MLVPLPFPFPLRAQRFARARRALPSARPPCAAISARSLFGTLRVSLSGGAGCS